jgi:glycosyltransferase involved in cell wall biosynthesis
MVSEHANPLVGSGGQDVHVVELGNALAAAGHEVTVWTRRDEAELRAMVPVGAGVVVRWIAGGQAGAGDDLVTQLPALSKALDEAWTAEPPDVVHAHFWLSGMAALAASGGRFPVVQTFHALGSVQRRHEGADDPSPAGRARAELAVARQADRVLATSTDEAFELARMGAPRRRMTVVARGVDTVRFAPDGPVAPRGGRPRVVAPAGTGRRTGVDELVEAMRRVPAAELVVVGGADPDDADAARVRECAARCGVADRVHLTGPADRDDVAALLRSADVVACVPWYEACDGVALEAMACGRPVVGSDVGGMRDTVVDQVTGVLVPPRRPDALATALRELLGSTTLAAAYGIAGRDRVLARYGWDQVGPATERVYTEVVAARSRVATANP